MFSDRGYRGAWSLVSALAELTGKTKHCTKWTFS